MSFKVSQVNLGLVFQIWNVQKKPSWWFGSLEEPPFTKTWVLGDWTNSGAVGWFPNWLIPGWPFNWTGLLGFTNLGSEGGPVIPNFIGHLDLRRTFPSRGKTLPKG